MKKTRVGLKVGLAFVVAGVISLAVASVGIVVGWIAVSIVVLVAIGAGFAIRVILRSEGGGK